MKDEMPIGRDWQEGLAKASAELHALAVYEEMDLTDSAGGTDVFWMDLRRREVTLTTTLDHILHDQHPSHDLPRAYDK